MTLCTISSRTKNSITFCATSNSVKPSPSEKAKKDLESLFRENETWTQTFLNPGGGNGRGDVSKKEASLLVSSSPSKKPNSSLHCAPYGLISSIQDAYNHHHNLVLRPDDVWQAILTQFSFYVNKNAEKLRDRFVDFKGKKTLVVNMPGNLQTCDYGTFANRMVDEKIAANLKDKDVTEWLIPNFTTTGPDDRVAASVTIMATLQSYFEYACCLGCGIPEVTLEGEGEDWRRLRDKIDRLVQYDIEGEMTKWHRLLVPVLDNFILSVEGTPSLEFWDTVCCHRGGGSGPSYLSGWVTVFGCLTEKGTWQGDVPERDPTGPHYRYARGRFFFGRRRLIELPEKKPVWPFIDTSALPVGTVVVPVLIDDNGVQYDGYMFAGQFGYDMECGQVLVRPRSDWCMAHTVASEQTGYKDGEIRP